MERRAERDIRQESIPDLTRIWSNVAQGLSKSQAACHTPFETLAPTDRNRPGLISNPEFRAGQIGAWSRRLQSVPKAEEMSERF
jgi:hypothetical protein